MKLVKKISVGGINNVRGGFDAPTVVEGKKRVMRIVGIARGYKEHVSATMGVSYGFQGEFRAWNLKGDECASAVCFLPEPAQGLLHEALCGEGGASVEFAFEFLLVPAPDSILKYDWEVVTLMDTKPSDGVARLVEAHGHKVPAPAPAPALEAKASIPVPVPESVSTLEHKEAEVKAKK